MLYTIRCKTVAEITERWQAEADTPEAAIEAVENGTATFICQIDCDDEGERGDFEAVPAEPGDCVDPEEVAPELLAALDGLLCATEADIFTDDPDFAPALGNLAAWKEQARSAMAKARGDAAPTFKQYTVAAARDGDMMLRAFTATDDDSAYDKGLAMALAFHGVEDEGADESSLDGFTVQELPL